MKEAGVTGAVCYQVRHGPETDAPFLLDASTTDQSCLIPALHFDFRDQLADLKASHAYSERLYS
jgi:hypothetical protein